MPVRQRGDTPMGGLDSNQPLKRFQGRLIDSASVRTSEFLFQMQRTQALIE